MNALQKFNYNVYGNRLPELIIDFSQFPEAREIKWNWNGDNIRFEMHFSRGNSCYLDVNPHYLNQASMEDHLDVLYKYGVEHGYVNSFANALKDVFAGAVLGIGIATAIDFCRKNPQVPIAGVVKYLQMRSSGTSSHEAALATALDAATWKALEQALNTLLKPKT